MCCAKRPIVTGFVTSLSPNGDTPTNLFHPRESRHEKQSHCFQSRERFSRACSFVLTFSALLVVSQGVAAQSKPTDGGTPLGLQAGAPDGSYSLGGGDNVNLYNGALNCTLPLLSVGGRGGAGHSIVLPFERHFMVEKYVDPWGGIWQYPIDGREEEIKPGYGPGVMAIRYAGGYPTACPTPTPEPGIEYDGDPTYYYGSTLTRLSFTRGDGTETEFRDVQSGGQTHSTAWHFNCDTGSPPWVG